MSFIFYLFTGKKLSDYKEIEEKNEDLKSEISRLNDDLHLKDAECDRWRFDIEGKVDRKEEELNRTREESTNLKLVLRTIAMDESTNEKIEALKSKLGCE